MRMLVSVSILLSVAFTNLWVVHPHGASAQTATPQRTLIRAGHLLDVHTGKTLDAQTIIVSGDRIVSIAPTASTPASSGDAVIDLGTLTVLPGLIDVHTHLTSNPEFDPFKEVTDTDAKDAINGVVNARTTLLAGFTTVRNVGAS
jgi:imidazolonepropionase-like amidohydrolase